MSDQFFVLGADNQTTGPFPESEVRRRLAAGELAASNLVAQEGWANWKPASEVFGPPPVPPAASAWPEVPASDGPERAAVASVRKKAEQLLTQGEQILYICSQALPGISHSGVVITTRRLMMIWPGLGGLKLKFEDWHWIDVLNVHIEEGLLGTTFYVQARARKVWTDRLHKEEARHAYRLAQQMEEMARSGRRAQDLEALRAGSALLSRNPAP